MLPSNLLFKSCRSFRRFSNVTTSSGSYTSMPAIDKKDAAKNSKYAPGQSKYTPKPVKEIPLSTLTLSFSSWFCVPDQGMTELEVLCRATGFLVKANNTMENRFKPKWHFVTVSHAAAPWKWPGLYPEEWLQFVNMQHTHYVAELRERDGLQITAPEMIPTVYHHETRDLCVMHFEDDGDVDRMVERGLNLKLKLSDVENMDLPVDTTLQFHGHVLPPQLQSTELDLRKPVPRIVNGSVFAHMDNRILGHSDSVLQMGMCGGPVILSSSVYGARANGMGIKTAVVVGMLEGIVPPTFEKEDYRNAPVWVEAADIKEFLRSIEEGEAEGEEGGEIQLYIGQKAKPDDYKDIESVVDGPRQVDPNAGSSLPMAPSEEALDELVAKVNSEKK